MKSIPAKIKSMLLSLLLIFIFNLTMGQIRLTDKDLTVLSSPANSMMKNYLTGITDRQFSQRDSVLSTLRTVDDWNHRSRTIIDSIVSWTGNFPDKTPLNGRITGKVEREGFTIEKILFESRPGFLVSGSLYLPKKVSYPRPAVLNVIGHFKEGKADDQPQAISLSLVKNGFIVLAIDCIGQGERKIPEYASWGEAPSNAHNIIGIQAFLTGTNLFNFMVWDAIRAIDYLVSRDEVDPANIGITGSSGGGMMSTYILPFEDRISVIVPTCNPNTWSYRVHANLGTDQEQVFFGAFESAIDPRGDPLFMKSPRPLLLNTTTDDHLNPPRGVWDLSTWLFKYYSVHGIPEKFSTSMVQGTHGYNKEQREVTGSWMLRWTGGDASNFLEKEEPEIEKAEELWSAKNGNVYETGSKHPQDLVLDYLNSNKPDAEKIRSGESLKHHKKKMTSLINDVLNNDFSSFNQKYTFGKPLRVGETQIKSFILEPEKGIMLPGVLLRNDKTAARDFILYINDKGKGALKEDIDIIDELLKNGHTICAVDLRGTGETAPSMSNTLWDFLAGKPVFGQRVYDILATIEWIKSNESGSTKIKIWGRGLGATYAAFASALSSDISGVVLEEPLISFESVVRVKTPRYGNDIILPGILKKFDMAQIYQAICPVPVAVVNPLSGAKEIAADTDIKAVNDIVLSTYQASGKPKSWLIGNFGETERKDLIQKALSAR